MLTEKNCPTAEAVIWASGAPATPDMAGVDQTTIPDGARDGALTLAGGGCNCRVASEPSSPSSLASLALVLAALALGRRRRR